MRTALKKVQKYMIIKNNKKCMYIVHIVSVQDKSGELMCEICSKTFKSVYLLNSHGRVHNNPVSTKLYRVDKHNPTVFHGWILPLTG